MNMKPDLDYPSLTVVIPCFNEDLTIDDTIRDVLLGLSNYRIDGKLIVVNDGSTDSSGEKIAVWCETDKRVSVIKHDTSRGLGGAFWSGVLSTTTDYVTWLPADNENDIKESIRYLYLARDVDIIVPFIFNVEVRNKIRRLLSASYRFIINMSFGTSLNYTNGTIIYNTEVLRSLRGIPSGFFFQAEVLVRLIRMGYLYAEVPHALRRRSAGTSSALSFRSFFLIIGSYLKLAFSVHILGSIGQTDNEVVPSSNSYRRAKT